VFWVTSGGQTPPCCPLLLLLLPLRLLLPLHLLLLLLLQRGLFGGRGKPGLSLVGCGSGPQAYVGRASWPSGGTGLVNAQLNVQYPRNSKSQTDPRSLKVQLARYQSCAAWQDLVLCLRHQRGLRVLLLLPLLGRAAQPCCLLPLQLLLQWLLLRQWGLRGLRLQGQQRNALLPCCCMHPVRQTLACALGSGRICCSCR
jgi:hypothetical protein